ncbi:hypothetical protein B9Z47_03545 [Limnohabitans sp. 2KL-1]|uniref:membrane protein insertion efficiency factor YidD n=1 Tax=Limnohabitans sp. 2KL-1 TaxID=1100699 RepID=UPI000D36B25E|nr:hypothetical protein B9Z47_03545 [Limnohabitans sp. 2KL-1]
MRNILLALIRGYQRFISPHKGFVCAYRVCTGKASCSALGYRVVRRFGVWRGLGLIRQRTHLCGVVHRHHAQRVHPRLHTQVGVCDVGCDIPMEGACLWPDAHDRFPCSMPSVKNCPCSIFDLFSCDGFHHKDKKPDPKNSQPSSAKS